MRLLCILLFSLSYWTSSGQLLPYYATYAIYWTEASDNNYKEHNYCQDLWLLDIDSNRTIYEYGPFTLTCRNDSVLATDYWRDSTYTLVFDFSANQGDTIRAWPERVNGYWVVDSVNQVEIDSILRRRQYVSFYRSDGRRNDYRDDVFVEGIGSLKGGIDFYNWENGFSTWEMNFMCIEDRLTLSYRYWNDQITIGPAICSEKCYQFASIPLAENKAVQIYPNPSNGPFTISSSKPLKQIKIYNNLGVLVSEHSISSPLQEYQINLANLPTTYYIMIQSEDEVWWDNILIE
ncbi:T9SS type A sorting domain-containing protein [bacterium]|nr:T9SS type A sorting domain-containing protein [bacterium]